MTWLDDETSQHDAGPVELYKFIAPNKTYYLTSDTQQHTFQSDLYLTATITRKQIKIGSNVDTPVLSVSMPVTELIVSEIVLGIAPRTLEVEIYRLHPETGNSLLYWYGDVTTFSIKKDICSFNIPSKFSLVLESPIPSVYYQGQCNHVLYDSRCQVVANDFRFITTVDTIAANGLDMIVTSVDSHIDGYYQGGEVIRTSDGERRLITLQVDKAITLNFGFPILEANDTIQLFAGCDRINTTCRDKFSNIINHSSHSFIPDTNPFVTGLK